MSLPRTSVDPHSRSFEYLHRDVVASDIHTPPQPYYRHFLAEFRGASNMESRHEMRGGIVDFIVRTLPVARLGQYVVSKCFKQYSQLDNGRDLQVPLSSTRPIHWIGHRNERCRGINT